MIHDIEQLVHDASALVAATSDVAGENVKEARHRLADGVDRAKEIYVQARSKARDSTRAADVFLHDNLYRVVATGVVAGVVCGFLLAIRCASRRE